jgi:hypothetical protein
MVPRYPVAPQSPDLWMRRALGGSALAGLAYQNRPAPMERAVCFAPLGDGRGNWAAIAGGRHFTGRFRLARVKGAWNVKSVYEARSVNCGRELWTRMNYRKIFLIISLPSA